MHWLVPQFLLFLSLNEAKKYGQKNCKCLLLVIGIDTTLMDDPYVIASKPLWHIVSWAISAKREEK